MTAPPILIVEDEHEDLRFIHGALVQADVSNPVLTASTVDEARRHCDERPPVLVLLDMHLAGGSGLEFVEWLRRQPQPLGRTPVIIFVTRTDGTPALQPHALRHALLLEKPVGAAVLTEAILAFGLERATVMRGGERRRWLAPREDDRQARRLPGTDTPATE